MSTTPAQTKTAEPTGEITPTATIVEPLSTATQEEEPSGVISLWHSWNESETEALVEVIDSFKALNPKVQFDVLYVPFDDLEARFETAVEEKGGPNILLGPSQWGPSLFDEGAIQDVSEWASNQSILSINPVARDEVHYRSELIGFPYALEGVLLFRNQGLISEAPETFNDLVSESQAATEGGEVGAYLDRGIFFSGAHLNGIGGILADNAGNPAFNNQKGIEWLELLKNFENAGPTEMNGNQDIELFEQGKVGFIIEGSWNTRVLADAIKPEILSIDPWPEYSSGHLSGYVQTVNLYLNINLQESDRSLSLAFMEFFLNQETQLTLSKTGFIPVLSNLQVVDPLIKQAMLAFEKGTAYPVFPDAGVYWQPLEDAMSSVFNGGVDAAQALQQAQEAIMNGLEEARKPKE